MTAPLNGSGDNMYSNKLLLILAAVLTVSVSARVFIFDPQSHKKGSGNTIVQRVFAQAPAANPASQAEGDVPTEEDYTNMMDLFKIGTTLMGGGPEDTSGGAAGRAGGTGGTGQPGTGSTLAVANWARQIASAAGQGCSGYYNVMTTSFTSAGYTLEAGKYPGSDCSNPGNRMWCADLVHEAFHLAGYSDFVTSSSVPSMRNWFLDGPAGYYHLDIAQPNQVLSQAQLQTVKSGCAIFYGSLSDPSNNRGDHIEVIDTVTTDANGNGSITTSAINSSNPSRTLVVDAGHIVGYSSSREIIGVGCHQ